MILGERLTWGKVSHSWNQNQVWRTGTRSGTEAQLQHEVVAVATFSYTKRCSEYDQMKGETRNQQ